MLMRVTILLLEGKRSLNRLISRFLLSLIRFSWKFLQKYLGPSLLPPPKTNRSSLPSQSQSSLNGTVYQLTVRSISFKLLFKTPLAGPIGELSSIPLFGTRTRERDSRLGQPIEKFHRVFALICGRDLESKTFKVELEDDDFLKTGWLMRLSRGCDPNEGSQSLCEAMYLNWLSFSNLSEWHLK